MIEHASFVEFDGDTLKSIVAAYYNTSVNNVFFRIRKEVDRYDNYLQLYLDLYAFTWKGRENIIHDETTDAVFIDILNAYFKYLGKDTTFDEINYTFRKDKNGCYSLDKFTAYISPYKKRINKFN